MRLPRLRIAQQLSLLLVGAVVLAVLAVGSLSVWNLRNGFTDYLRLRDEEQLTRLVKLVEARAAADGGMEWLRDNREAMRELMDEFSGRDPRGRRGGPPPPRGPGRPPPDGPEGNRPPPPIASGGSLPQRVLIRDAQGYRLAGREGPPGAHPSVRAVKLNGVDVATIEAFPEPKPEGLDAGFLQRQYTGLAFAALATITAALLTAWWVAGRWSRPLRELQLTTRRIARGDLSVQTAVTGDAPATRAGAVEIEQLVLDVDAMAVALAALEAARRHWIAEISHELRTPLAVLRGELESIEDGARQPTPQLMASLREEVLQLTRLVDDLHTLAVADLGQMPCEFVQGNANDALHRITRRFERRASQLGLRLEIRSSADPVRAAAEHDASSEAAFGGQSGAHSGAHSGAQSGAHSGTRADLRFEACWDFGRIEQLISNLLENSLRYTTAPGLVQVAWQVDNGWLTLTLDDSAPGVAEPHLPKLFEPLFRVDASRTRTGQHGSGLGLSIVKAIARAHRGSVTAAASGLGGVAMRVELPLMPHQLERRKRA